MSVKQTLVQAIDALPDSISLEEALERLYRLFESKRMHAKAATKGHRRAAGSARGLIHLAPDSDAPLDDFGDYQ